MSSTVHERRFNTAKVLGNMFELVPVINSIKDGLIRADALSFKPLNSSGRSSKYPEDVFGLQKRYGRVIKKLGEVMDMLIGMRKAGQTKISPPATGSAISSPPSASS